MGQYSNTPWSRCQVPLPQNDWNHALREPFGKDLAKTLALFGAALAGLWLGAHLEVAVVGWAFLALLVYSMAFFVRVWWRLTRSIFSGKAYERV